MKKNVFLSLTKFEICLWVSSMIVMVIGFVFNPENGVLDLVASLIGVTALIFVAKGHVLGQMLTIVFALLYGIAALEQKYYGEMITYIGMSAPMALASLISWIRHPYKDTSEVKVSSLTKKSFLLLLLFTAAVTIAFYFILDALNTSRLVVSTLSVATSFLAVGLTFLRSPYYALAYSANDIVLIILWVLASVNDPSCRVMTACFVMFLFNDLYGFYNWRRMKKRQNEA